MSNDYRPIKTPWSQQVDHFKQRTLPLIVWCVSGLVAVGLLATRAQRFDYIGLAYAPEYEISAGTTGKLKSVAVSLYERVQPGDVVARLDDTGVAARIETVNASVNQLRSELEARRAELLADSGQGLASWTKDLRRFQIDEEERRLDALSLRVVIESDQIELERLALELRQARPLFESGLISEFELESIRLGHERLARQIEENRLLLDQMDQEYQATQARRLAYQQELPQMVEQEPLLRPLRDSVEVEMRRLREIEVERSSLVLRSPVFGQVSKVLCWPGQTVVPGEPILSIAEQSVQEIVAFLGEGEGADVVPNTPVLVSNRSRPGPVAESVVLRVGPTVETLPQRLWGDPRLPEYGRAVVIAAAPGMNLLPGEMVSVQFRPAR